MSDSIRRTRGVQRGPRSVQVVESVRSAVLAELARAGFAGLTIDGVARAAAVNRTTIYRRWPTKSALLAAAVEPLMRRFDSDPDTGAVFGDLMELCRLIRDNEARPEGRALTQAVAAGGGELADLVAEVTSRAIGPFRRVLDRAAERGEIPASTDREMMAYLAFHGVVLWEQSHGVAPSDDDCARLLGVVLGR